MTDESIPLLQTILSDEAWHRLAPAVRSHYRLSPNPPRTMTLSGMMDDIFHIPLIKPLLLLASRLDALVAFAGSDIPVTVRNWTNPNRPQALFWHRTFTCPDGRTRIFRSRMEATERPGEVVELLRYGVGIRMRVVEREGALVYLALEHCWKIGRWFVPIPNWALLGTATIVERAISDREVYLDFVIEHPWYGRTFGYRGRFSLPDDVQVG